MTSPPPFLLDHVTHMKITSPLAAIYCIPLIPSLQLRLCIYTLTIIASTHRHTYPHSHTIPNCFKSTNDSIRLTAAMQNIRNECMIYRRQQAMTIEYTIVAHVTIQNTFIHTQGTHKYDFIEFMVMDFGMTFSCFRQPLIKLNTLTTEVCKIMNEKKKSKNQHTKNAQRTNG